MGDLLTRKLHRGFDFMDIDGRGEIDEHTYAVMAERAAQAHGFGGDSAQARRVHDRYVALWRDALALMAPPGRDALNRDEFVEAISALVRDDLPRADAVLRGVGQVFLESADLDQDGRISPAEFHTYQRAHFPTVSADDLDVAFSRMDADGDGYLSAQEFVDATVAFWTSTDPESPGNWWLGPLPD